MLPGLTAEAVTGGMYEIVYGRVLRDAIAELPSLLPELMYWALMPFLGHAAAAEEMERMRVAAVAPSSGDAAATEPAPPVPPRRSGRRPRAAREREPAPEQ